MLERNSKEYALQETIKRRFLAAVELSHGFEKGKIICCKTCKGKMNINLRASVTHLIVCMEIETDVYSMEEMTLIR